MRQHLKKKIEFKGIKENDFEPWYKKHAEKPLDNFITKGSKKIVETNLQEMRQ